MRDPLALTLVVLGFIGLGCGSEPAPPAAPPQPAPPPPVAIAPAETANPIEPAPPPASPPAPVLAKAILAYVDGYNAGSFEKAAAAFADDAEWISAGSAIRPATGRSEIATSWKEMHEIFDIKVAVRRLFVTKDMWVAEGVLKGSHVGAFHGFAATKKPVGVEYVHVGWIDGGKIKRLLSLSNGTAFTRQIGFTKGENAPLPAAPGEPELVLTEGDAQSAATEGAIIGAMLKGDLAGWSATVAKDVVFHDGAAGKTVTGLEAAKKAVAAGMGGFSELTRDVKTFAAGPYVVSIGTTTGTHSKLVGATKPTGAKVTFNTVDVVKLKDGKAVEIELFHNPKEILDAVTEAAEAKAPAKAAKK